jgi:DNA-binding response OmpR family regulator
VATPPCRRIATIDRDSEFLRALSERAKLIDWTLIVHPGPVNGATLLGGRPHAVLVDIELLGPRWDDWLMHHPAKIPNLGVLVCTGESTVRQRVRGLGVGADDWITKPCHPEEVIARLEAIVRRSWRHVEVDELRPVRAGELEVRTDLYEVFAKRKSARLTHYEYEILLQLVRHQGEVLGRGEIYREVWGYEMARGDRSIDTFVRKIRAKLRKVSPAWDYIHTHKGVGYRFGAERRHGRADAGSDSS